MYNYNVQWYVSSSPLAFFLLIPVGTPHFFLDRSPCGDADVRQKVRSQEYFQMVCEKIYVGIVFQGGEHSKNVFFSPYVMIHVSVIIWHFRRVSMFGFPLLFPLLL